MYIRFVVATRDQRSKQQQGVFTALYRLERDGELVAYEKEWFEGLESWFNAHLKRPERLAWSSRPNAPTQAITWLRLSSAEHVRKMRELSSLLQHKGIPVEEIRTDKPGYIVYEDEHQVAAMPFHNETY